MFKYCVFLQGKVTTLKKDGKGHLSQRYIMIRTQPDLLTYIENLTGETAGYFQREQREKNAVLIDVDKRYQWIYILSTGLAKCYLPNENGKEYIQEFLGAGMFFGEIEFFNGKRSYCVIEALSEVVLYKISFDHFRQLLAKDTAFNALIMKGLAEKISYKAPRSAYQASYTVEENLTRLLTQAPELLTQVAKTDVANYLGITPRSLNRALLQRKEKNKKL